MGKNKKGVNKEKVGRQPLWWTDKSSIGLFAGFGLTYLALLPLEAHQFHWLFSSLGAVLGYGVGLFLDRWLSSAKRLFRHGLRGASSGKRKGNRVGGISNR
jgi:hypothetical protein